MKMSADLMLWLPFAAGQAIHMLKRAGMSVRSRANRIDSRRAFFRLYWDALLIRAALCAGVFAVLLDQPALLSTFASQAGLAANLAIRLNVGTAFVFGYFADSILDWLVSRFPRFQKEVPFCAAQEGHGKEM